MTLVGVCWGACPHCALTASLGNAWGWEQTPVLTILGAAGQRGSCRVCEDLGAPTSCSSPCRGPCRAHGALTRAGPTRWGGDRPRHPGGHTHLCPVSLQVPMGCQPSQRSGAMLEAQLSVAGAGGAVGGSGPGRSGCSPHSLQLCFVPDPWCVPRRDRNSLLPALHNSLPTPLLPGHCIWSPGWLPPSAPAAPWIRELLFFQRKSCFPSQRWGWKAGEGGLPLS